MAYDLNQALRKLEQINKSGMVTPQALLNLVSSVSVDVSGSVTVFYSGKLPDSSSSAAKLVQDLVSSGQNIRILDKSAAAIFVDSLEFKTAVAKAFNIPLDDLLDSTFNHPAKDWFHDPVSGPWADVSRRFAASSSGDVRVIAPEGDKLRIFAQTELPELLKNPNVSHIDGIPRTQLVEVLEKQGLAAVQEFTFNHARLKTELSGILKGDVQKYLSLTPDAYAEVLKDPAKYKAVDAMFDGMSAARKDAFRNSMRVAFYVGEDMAAKGLSKVANKLGPLGVMAGFLLAANSASAAEAAGQPEKAKEIMSEWAVDSVGSSAGEVVGGAIGGIALAAVAAWGLTISAPVIGAVMVGATLLGGIFGGDAAKGIYDLAKDLDASGRKDLLDKLGKLVFGTNYSITSPLPADLNGERLTLDTTVSRKDIVGNAKLKIAWRYALRELNPFVIPDVSYEQHNLDGSLDLYDSVTGKGRMTESYLQDRAAMLTWLIRINKLDQTELKSLAVGDEAWAFRDVASGRGILVLPDKLLSGTAPRHYVTFGGVGADALSGAELSDHLYGGAGDDTLTGFSGQDYLEGGLGKDTYVVDSSGGGDVIVDSDGKGAVQWSISGTQYTLAGGKRLSNGTWLSEDRRFVFSLTKNAAGRDDLSVAADGGVLRVRNFSSGQLGIVLDNEDGPKPAGSGTAGNDDLGSLRVTQASGLAGNDLFYGADGNVAEWVDGGADRDILLGLGGDDELFGGAGDDFIIGGNGADLIDCGEGADVVLAGTIYRDGSGNTVMHPAYLWSGSWSAASTYWQVKILSGSQLAYYDDPVSQQYMPIDSSDPIRHGWLGILWEYSYRSDAPSGITSGIETDTVTTPASSRMALGADTIFGGLGNDVLVGSGADDLIDGGEGDDIVSGLEGDEQLFGGAGNDQIAGNVGTDLIDGGSGNDTLWGGIGADSILGSGGADDIHGDFGAPGFAIPVETYALSGNDLLLGGDGDDALRGDGGDDSLFGEADNDLLVGDDALLSITYHGNDLLDGGIGSDTLLGLGGNDALFGGDGADFLVGDNDGADPLPDAAQGADWLDGGIGDDQLEGNGGNDTLIGGIGRDILSGGDGDDVYIFEKGDFLVNSEGTSDAIIDSGGNDILLIKGYRRDEAYLTQANGDQDFVVFSTLGGESIQVAESWGNTIEKVLFQDYANITAKQSQPSQMRAALVAETASEQASATAFWNEGYSEVSFQELFSRSPYTLNWTGKGNTADTFYGGTQGDVIFGGDGNDQLYGHAGNDWLNGGNDDDTLSGGQGDDRQVGGEGQDVFLLEDDFGHDVITDSTGITRQFQDTIRFTGSVTQSSLSFYRNGNQLILFKDPDNWAAVSEYFSPEGSSSSARIEFVDGSSMDYAAVLALCGTDANVRVGFGTQGDDAIDARGSATISSMVLLFDGNDYFLNTEAARDKVFGGSGNDTIFGDDPAEFNAIYAPLSPEAADAEYKADFLDGGDGNDGLYGGSGKDTLVGGRGDDLLWGGKGDDVYLINVGDGSDRIINYEKTPTDMATDEVRFGEGIVPDDLTLLRSGNDLLVIDQEYRFQLNIQNAFANGQDLSSFFCVDLFRFSNGQILTRSQLNERIRYSTPENDVIYLERGFRSVHADSGDDEIWGTSDPDTIYGDGGNDSLHGAPGVDSLIGGKGDDTYWVSNQGAEIHAVTTPEFEDIVIEEVDSGIDTLIVDTFSATLPDNVENLIVSDIKQLSNRYAGDSWMPWYSAHWYQGNSLDNVIDSSAANRPPIISNVTLYGGSGADTLIGGANDETYIVDDPTDVVIETGSGDTESTDDVEASFSYTLSDHLENLRLTTENTRGEGNSLNNVLIGQGGSTLIGGEGDDTYFAPASSTVIEEANGGHDVLHIVTDMSLSGIDGTDETFRITDYANIEGLTLAGGGNASLLGGDGNDVLEISAWAGTIEGAAGDDSLFLFATTGGQVDGGNGNDYIESRPDSSRYLPMGLILGGEGNDTISLFSSDYVVDGGSGNDLIVLDGLGACIRFGLGSGTDRVECDENERTEIQLSTGIRPSDITLARENGETALSLSDGSRLTIQGYYPSIRFDNEFWPASMVEAYLNGGQIINGTTGNDMLSGGAGSDSIIGDLGNDSIQGLGGDDTLNGNGGNDIIDGGQGNDSITGDNGQDTLFGGDGDDTLEAGDDSTTLEGGGGNDFISMGQGSDRLILSGDFGKDTVRWFSDTSEWGQDSIVFSDIQSLSALKFSEDRSSGDLLIEILGAENSVNIKEFFSLDFSNNLNNARIGISDSTGGIRWLTGDEIRADLLAATDGNDTLAGFSGSNDIIYGLKGDDDLTARGGADTLIGGSGSDTYRFALDGGFDRVLINNGAVDGAPGDIDTIVFGSYSSSLDSVEYLRVKDDLILNVNGYSDSRRVQVAGYFSLDGATDSTVDLIALGEPGAPSSGWTYSQVKTKAVTVNGLAIEGNDDANSIVGTVGDDTLGGGAGNDSIDGEAGDDLLAGGLGENTYFFGKGDGRDVISSFNDTMAGKLNTLQLQPGVLAGEILVSRSGADLCLRISGTSDSVTVKDFFYQDNPLNTRNPIQQLKFADGATWDLDTIVAKLLPANLDLAGTTGADALSGGAGNDTLYGYADVDQLHGLGGDDQLFGDRAKAIIVVSAKATLAVGVGAQMEVWLDGKKIGAAMVDSTATRPYEFLADLDIGAEASKLDILFSNDAVISGEDRNLIVSSVKLNGYEMKPTDPGVVLDKGVGAAAFDNQNVIRGQAGLYWNGALRFTLPVSVFGTAGGDSLFGDQGNDTLNGGAGDDTLDGGADDDTYLFGRGSGADTIVENDASVGNTDVLSIGAGVAADQLWFRRVGVDLEVSIIGSSDKTMIGNWFNGSAYHVEQFKVTDGRTLSDSQVDALVSAMASFAPPAAGQFTLPANYQSSLNPVIAANWR